jgi:small subunit ribosomal protein S6
MRRYETITILDPDLSEDQRTVVFSRLQELIPQQGGFLAFVDEWGSRQLGYEIKKKERGYYVRFDYCGTGAVVDEIERLFRIDDRVLKYMTVLTDDDPNLDSIKEEIVRAEAEKAKIEEAKAAAAAEPSEPQTPEEDATDAPESLETPTPQDVPKEAAEPSEPQNPEEDATDASESLETPTPQDVPKEAAEAPEPEAPENEATAAAESADTKTSADDLTQAPDSPETETLEDDSPPSESKKETPENGSKTE